MAASNRYHRLNLVNRVHKVFSICVGNKDAIAENVLIMMEGDNKHDNRAGVAISLDWLMLQIGVLEVDYRLNLLISTGVIDEVQPKANNATSISYDNDFNNACVIIPRTMV